MNRSDGVALFFSEVFMAVNEGLILAPLHVIFQKAHVIAKSRIESRDILDPFNAAGE